jgi:hypothetical protein
MQCTIGISQRVTFSARILLPADIESISYTSIVAPANNVGVTPRAAIEHEFVNANMSRAALSAESLLLRLINARAAHKSRSAIFEASVERDSECEKSSNCRAYLNRCVERDSNARAPLLACGLQHDAGKLDSRFMKLRRTVH